MITLETMPYVKQAVKGKKENDENIQSGKKLTLHQLYVSKVDINTTKGNLNI